MLVWLKTIYDETSFESIFLNSHVLTTKKLEELKQLDINRLSHGEKIYLQYNKEGVRKEAYLGFPIVQEALKIINLDNKDTLVQTLITIMSLCEDTTIIHRKGINGLNYVKKTMRELIAKGYDKDMMKFVNEEFIDNGISPGGSADLLCGTVFLSLVRNKLIIRRDER